MKSENHLRDTLVCINGKFTPPEEAYVSIFDRGFLYGDSIYEVTLTYDKIPFLLTEHLDRLENSAKGIGLELTWTREQITKLIYAGLEQLEGDRFYIRVIVTRGAGEIGLDPNLSDGQNLFIIFRDLKEQPKKYYSEGVHLITADIIRTPKRAIDPNVKSGNYLNNVMAISQAKEKNAYDAVMLNGKGFVTESTTANIWIIKYGMLLTPPLDAGLLGGITRQNLIELAKANNYNVLENNFTPDDLRDADEAFITSSTREVMPVTKVDDSLIGTGKPGPLTQELHKIYRDFVQRSIKEEKKKALPSS